MIKGVLHIHSTYSYDGKESLGDLKKIFIDRGYSFACMSEHTEQLSEDQARRYIDECRALSDDHFLFVPGFEIAFKDAHVLVYGVREWVGESHSVRAIASYKAQGAHVVLAHPHRNKFQLYPELVSLVDGVEVWNSQYDGKQVPRTTSLRMQKKVGLSACCGIDFHRKEHVGGPALMFDTMNSLSVQTVVALLQSGAYAFGDASLRISASGKFLVGRSTLVMSLVSMVSIAVIRIGKACSSVFAKTGIRIPEGVRMGIRKIF